MVKFRRSLKSDKSDLKPLHTSIPAKDAIAILPPKKVIKALYDYAPPNEFNYLKFSQGDFLHVVGREDDPEWYEACNPLEGRRGLVPVKYFEIIDKRVRNSGGSTGSNPTTSSHDSGYAENAPLQQQQQFTSSTDHSRAAARMSKLKGAGNMVYGIVMYDFKAERPDELEAREGEAIIVIAQSNPEWFVAKPITRLGGPGLIPVSFVEIRDMTTGQAVPDASAAVQRAGVPKVEEWKKMAADYKNGSIPLGRLGGDEAGSSGAGSLQQGMQNMSVSSKNPKYASAGYSAGGNGARYSDTSRAAPQLLAPTHASVPRYCFADDIFWFIVECKMEDGRHWELSRLYQDFYDLQINLIQEYPYEAGNVEGVERSLPYMPGPVTYVTDNISNGRRQNLDEYIRNLLKLGPHITQGYLVRRFFAPRPGDYEIDPEVADNYRLSGESQQRGFSGGNPYAQHAQTPRGPNPQSHFRDTSRSQSSGTSGAATTTTMASSAPPPSSTTGAAVKIKVWFSADNCVVIRMPPAFRYADLYRKLKERRGLEKLECDADENAELVVEYRDDAEGRMRLISGDEGLREALERNPKLTLSVSVR